ncbi:transposable element Tcb2 transposase [Trichonephila clavipes]|nr:transposable element Tcb2 transposase [Trichonephila clavipes]
MSSSIQLVFRSSRNETYNNEPNFAAMLKSQSKESPSSKQTKTPAFFSGKGVCSDSFSLKSPNRNKKRLITGLNRDSFSSQLSKAYKACSLDPKVGILTWSSTIPISLEAVVSTLSTGTGVLMSALSIRRRLLHRELRARWSLYRIPHTASHRQLRLQWAHEHKAWQVDFLQVVFSDESRFNLKDHRGRICVRCYASKRCLPECIIEQHSGLTPGIMQDNARLHVPKTVRDFCSAQHMKLLPWSAYSPDMSPIEHVRDLFGRRLARDPRPAASKD